ncbi:uncharacterized protein LOC134792322 [Cydia splendana]|uniref:uncharacterized protein LOC134792322 n=1 Tax=Cydia splendana TaxID=1100963 RepID=UPI00300D6DAE
MASGAGGAPGVAEQQPQQPLQQPPAGAPPAASSERTDAQLDLAAVTVASRLPEFWADQPRHWFIQVEAILNPQHLKDQARYDLVLGKLTKSAIGQITDLLLQPPVTGKYEALKEKLLAIYEDSAKAQLQKLLSDMELGEQKPSHLLRKMRDLARGKVPDQTLCILWQNHLPQAARAAVAVADSQNLDSLAAIADKVLEAVRPTPHVAEVQASTSRGGVTQSPEMAAVLAALERLEGRICGLEEHSKRSGRGRFRQRGRSASRSGMRQRSGSRGRSSTRRTPDSPDWLCSYHFRYREKAQRCVPPCAWSRGQPAGNE